jgi:hypothetical protein
MRNDKLENVRREWELLYETVSAVRRVRKMVALFLAWEYLPAVSKYDAKPRPKFRARWQYISARSGSKSRANLTYRSWLNWMAKLPE